MSYDDESPGFDGPPPAGAEMGPGHPDWPTKPDGTPLSPAAAAAVLRGKGQTVPGAMASGKGSSRRSKSDGPGDEYVEVNERLQDFYSRYPTGAVVTTKVKLIGLHELDELPRVMVQAKAYRTPDDLHPGVGTSWMVVPGKTPYTNGSELENAETSAWGRAMASIGILVNRGIASAGEIRSKGGDSIDQPSIVPTTNADALREAAIAAAGPEPVSMQGDGAPAPAGTPESAPVADGSAPVEAETPAAATTRATNAGATDAGVAAAVETTEMPKGATGTAETPAKAPKAGKKAEAAPDVTETATGDTTDTTTGPVQEGLTFEEFIKLAREKYVPNAHIAATARRLVEKGQLRQVGGVKEFTDQERLALLMVAIADAPEEAK